MNQQLILQPAAALMLLTLLVWLYMYTLRISWIHKSGAQPQSLSTPEAINNTLPERVNRPSNNLKNLFELPVIFYALCALLLTSGRVDSHYLKLAWIFVGLRALHSMIQCTINVVNLRFSAYILSSMVLWWMVLRFALSVF